MIKFLISILLLPSLFANFNSPLLSKMDEGYSVETFSSLLTIIKFYEGSDVNNTITSFNNNEMIITHNSNSVNNTKYFDGNEKYITRSSYCKFK